MLFIHLFCFENIFDCWIFPENRYLTKSSIGIYTQSVCLVNIRVECMQCKQNFGMKYLTKFYVNCLRKLNVLLCCILLIGRLAAVKHKHFNQMAFLNSHLMYIINDEIYKLRWLIESKLFTDDSKYQAIHWS